MMKKRCVITLTALLALLGVRAADDDDLVITNDVFWRTTAGAPIYSQGGGIFRPGNESDAGGKSCFLLFADPADQDQSFVRRQ